MSQASAATSKKADSARLSDKLPDETLNQWLYDMQLIREFESRTMQAYQQAKIGGFCHIYTGQEAVVVGTFACTNKNDPIVTAYRDHGHALARGLSPEACMAEMFGKLEGCAKGKGGSMHMFDRPNNMFGGHGIVSAQTPLGAGLAFAARYKWEVLEEGDKQVCLCFLGDGALDQGAFHEAQNMASLYGWPVIYVLENNGYSMGTSIDRHTANFDNLPDRAKGYGIKGVKIDGFDVCNIYDELLPIVDECRDLQRPAFIDLKTYRYQGHSMSDPQKYRTKDEVEEFKSKDSIAMLLSHLMNERNSITEDGWKSMQKEIKDRVKAALDFAEAGTDPDPRDEQTTDVYAYPVPNLSPAETYSHGRKNPLM